MTATVLVLGFPLLAAVGFGLITLAEQGPLRGRRVLERYGPLCHIGFLLIPVAAVWVELAPSGGVPALFTPPASRPLWSIALWLFAGAAAGGLLYAVEVWGTLALRNTPGLGRLMRHPAMEANIAVVRRQVRQLTHPAAYLAVGGTALVLEEIAWRGFLLPFLQTSLGLSTAVALLVAGASFGLNHAYFGLRSFLFKAVHGVVWGLLFVVSGLLLVAVVSHFVFNIWVWLRLRKEVADEPSTARAR